jgi:ABC-type branched-subunit amino acid transport system substrate-binding protein
MSKTVARRAALVLALVLVVAACGSSSKTGGGGSGTTAPAEKIDYKALGLWDDGPCDTAKPPLKIGLMTVFESPVLSLKDQATALEVSAKQFNARGGANGSCIQVTTCDDGGNADQAVGCVRTIDKAGVVATVNDQGTAGQADVSAAMAKAGIPRVASNVVQDDWGDQNAYPTDASGTGVTFLMPETLIAKNVKKIGLIRVDLAAASALKGLLGQLYEKDGVTFPYDAPVPAGTTDYSQFLLGADKAGTGGVTLALGDNEAIQIVKAGQQTQTEQQIGASLGTFPHKDVAGLGDFAKQMSFVWSFAPATADVPVYKVLRADLASGGDEQLQPENLKASPMRSWIGLYALLKMMRDAKMTTFTRAGVTAMLKKAKNVPMLGMYGDDSWTPNLNHPGLFKRAGMNHWEVYTWDPNADSVAGKGNFAPAKTLNWDEVMCGSIFGKPAPCP